MLSLLYGLAAYVAFAATFGYVILFSANLVVPKTIDGGAVGPMGEAIAVNLVLLGVFAAQHSVMARRGFKRWWTRVVPEAVERSTYVLAASLALALVAWQWQPIPRPVVWSVESGPAATAMWVVFWLGWGLVLLASFLINHFELFGLRQAASPLLGKPVPDAQFRTPFLYRYVRHPLYFGLVLAFWSVPTMSAGHLLFSAGATGYILVGIWFEERDLVHQFGDTYRRYRNEVGMLLPWRKT
ncbi:MAG TPA: isoprenylcysteine carboxylmethyltransferase family protein [Usitatibacter sp.]|nr:isoprenylcysteine carboxylmethyltransferase family protein [Usitatibacter sp.]